jgi:hypothetical protein
MKENEVIYNYIPIVEEHNEVTIDEVMPVIEMAEIESYNIQMQEAFPATEGNTSYNHALLNNREIHDAHPITSITGLREELDSIEALQTIYSDKKGNADYYEWANGHAIGKNGAGYFVTLNNDTYISICTGDDIFGVVVDSAAFVGGQDDVSRDSHYGLVATTGVVPVRCELDVVEGDYVVSNLYGVATKSGSNCGYKVVALRDIQGVPHAIIKLNITADQINLMGAEIKDLDSRMDAAETNIVSAVNVANQAYQKAVEAGSASTDASNKAQNALDTSNKVLDSVGSLENAATQSQIIAAQAKAIAEGTMVSAEAMCQEAIKNANHALVETEKLREDFKDIAGESSEEIAGAINDMKELMEDLQPLVTWPKDATGDDIKGVGGFVTRADKDSVTLATMVQWKGDAGESLAGFVQEATEENATVKALTSYEHKDANDKVIASGAAGLISQVDATQSEVSAIANREFTKNNGTVVTGLAGLNAYVNENESNVTLVANRVAGEYTVIPELIAEDKRDTSKLYASYNDTTKNTTYYYYTNKWNSTVEFKSIPYLKKYVIYYVSVNKLYWYYDNNDWKSTDNAYTAGLPSAIAGIQVETDDNSASINSLTSWQGETNTAMARIEQKADANGAYIQSTVANIGRYVVGPHSQAYGFTLEQAAEVLEEGMIYAPTEKVTEIYKRANKAIESKTTDDISKVYCIKIGSNRVYRYYGWNTSRNQYDWNGITSFELIPDYERTFLPGYLYKWGRINGVGHYGWTTVDKNYTSISYDETDTANQTNTSGMSVYFKTDSAPAIATNSQWGYWYTNGETDATVEGTDVKYEPYTLYKWTESTATILVDDENVTVEDEDGNPVKFYHWAPVATLEGNSQSRAVSQIRQDANSIEMSVTDLQGNYAGVRSDLNDTQAAVQQLSEWKTGEEANMATVKTVSDANGASVVISALQKKGDVVEEMASLVLNVVEGENGTKSGLSIDADYIQFDGFVTFASKDDVDAVRNNAIYQTETQFALSTSSEEFVAHSAWFTEVPERQDDTYIWQRTVVIKGDNTAYPYAPIYMPSLNGDEGAPAYTIILTNENHTFAGKSTGVGSASASTDILAYKGDTPQIITVKEVGTKQVNGNHSTNSSTALTTGITFSCTKNGTSSPHIEFYVTSSFNKKNYKIPIVIEINGLTFTKDFTCSVVLAGKDGQDATSYWLTASDSVIHKAENGTLAPGTVTFYGKSQTGTNAVSDYKGTWSVQYTKNGQDYSNATYTVSEDGCSTKCTIDKTWMAVKARLYQDEKQTILLDEQTVPIISDGISADPVYMITLTNESHTFAGDSNGKASGRTETNVYVYKGANAQIVKVTKVGGIEVNGNSETVITSGLLFTCTSNQTKCPSVEFRITTSFARTEYIIPITVEADGKEFTKDFKFVITSAGKDGQDATAYWLTASDSVIHKTENGTFTPTAITFYGKSQTGTSGVTDYAGRWLVESTVDGEEYSPAVTLNFDATSASCENIKPSWLAIRCRLYQAGAMTVLLDEQTVPIISDGATGSQGDSVDNIYTRYDVSANNTSPPSNESLGWTISFDDVLEEYHRITQASSDTQYYIWSQIYTKYTSGREEYSKATVGSAESIIASWCKSEDKTKIDGGMIATGTIIADSIAADTITTDKLKAKAVTADKIDATNLEVENAVVAQNITVADAQDNIIFSASSTGGTVNIGGWNVSSKELSSEIKYNPYDSDEILTGIRLMPGGEDVKINKNWVNCVLSAGSSFAITPGGAVRAYSGTISGWELYNETLSAYNVGLISHHHKDEYAMPSLVSSDYSSQIRIYAGSQFPAQAKTEAKFVVLDDGSVYAQAMKLGSGPLGEDNTIFLGTTDMVGSPGFFEGALRANGDRANNAIDNWRLTVGSNFGVTSDGSLHASNAIIDGAITSNNAVVTGGYIEFYNDDYFQDFTLINKDGLKTGAKGGAALGFYKTTVSVWDTWNAEYNDYSSAVQKITFAALKNDNNEIYDYQGELRGVWKSESSIGLISDSDATIKHDISPLNNVHSQVFDGLKPVVYKYNNGASDRIHTGFIAQEVEEAILSAGLTTKDFGAVCYNIDDSGNKVNYGIRYEEFISLCVYEIQKLKARVAELEAQQNDSGE